MSLIPYQTYKPINLQWLERVPEHWELKALKHCIARLGSGGTPESGNPDYWSDEEDEEGIPWVSIGDMTTKPIVTSTQKRITRSGLAAKGLEIFPVGSLLYSIYASLGKVATLGIDATFNQAILAIVPDETTVSQSYLCYWLQSLEAHLAYYASSNTQANLNAAKVLSYPVSLPSQEEQLAIASFLDRETAKIDALIAEQQRLIELLQEKRQAVISHAVTKGLNPNAPMKDSGVEWLGEVPEHWAGCRFKHCLEGLTDGEHKTCPDYSEGEYLIIRTSNIRDGSLVLDGAKYTDVTGYKEWTARCTPKAGDIVFTREAPAGEACIISEGITACLGQRTVLMHPSLSKVTPEYLVSSIYSGAARTFIQNLSQGSTVSHLNMSEIGNLPIALPPLEEQLRINEYTRDQSRKFHGLMQQAQTSIKLFQERRSALISAAVTGQIDVRRLVEAGADER